jgi:hypothetical protein
MKIRKARSKLAVLAAAGLLVALVPGTADATAQSDIQIVQAPDAAGFGECTAVGVVKSPSTMDLVVEGHATVAGAIDVSIVCHVWQDFGPHRDIGGTGAGPVAAAAGTALNFRLDTYHICAEVFITTLSGGRHFPCH